MLKLKKTVSTRSASKMGPFPRWLRDVKSHSSSLAIRDLKAFNHLNIPPRQDWHELCLLLQKFLLSSNKPLSILTAGVVGELFRDRKISSECDSRLLIKALLQRSAHTDPTLRSRALKALEMGAKNLSLQRTVSILMKDGVTSVNPLVRASTSLMFTWLISEWGPNAIFALPKALSYKFLRAIDKLAFDVRPETRTNCRMAVGQLTESKVFLDKFGGSHGKSRSKLSLPSHQQSMKLLMKIL